MEIIENFTRKVTNGKITFERTDTGSVKMLETKYRILDDETGTTETYQQTSEWSSAQLRTLRDEIERRKTELLNQANDADAESRFIDKLLAHVEAKEQGNLKK